ncbi:MAG TPA: PilZ domain-containing protein [Candidatus Sulfotelmatobacter sp.]|jgi:hypothetical protein|nr:PilZ domain-containing protein [Candidatus Sulfotelmatobacter sp.]
MSSHQLAYAQKRRSTRIDRAIPLVVQGVGALREPYQEQVSTSSISCHGCSYSSKHEVIQGETVYIDLPKNTGSAGTSSRARVKWVQKTNAKDRAYQIAVELEVAGNIWGIPTPPEDWISLQAPQAHEATPAARELKVVPRKEQQAIAPPATAVNVAAHPAKVEAPAVSVPPIAQLMVGLGEQIQTMASEAAGAVLVKEKGRVVEEFRLQLREETSKAIHAALSASKEVIVHHTLKDLRESYEAAARNSYAQWRKKLEEDVMSAQQHLVAQAKELSQKLEVIALKTVERVQHNLETTRGEAVDRFVTRLRDQMTPLLAEAKESVQKLEASGTALKKESEELCAGFENQLSFSASTSLARVQEEFDKSSSVISEKTNEALQKLYQDFERTAQDNVNALLGSISNEMTKDLQDRAGEVSREYSAGLQDFTRNYLESIGKSIAEISQKIPGDPRQ